MASKVGKEQSLNAFLLVQFLDLKVNFPQSNANVTPSRVSQHTNVFIGELKSSEPGADDVNIFHCLRDVLRGILAFLFPFFVVLVAANHEGNLAVNLEGGCFLLKLPRIHDFR